MKKIVLLILMFLPVFSMAQLSTVNPDSVCLGSTTPSTYEVTNTVGYTYTWTANGNILTGQGTNQITVDWSTAPAGLITNGVSVFATSSDGCVSPTVFLDVLIYNIAPTIVSMEFCEGEPCEPLVGTPAGGVWSGPNVVNGTFCPTTAGTSSVTYTVTVVGCAFSTTATNFVVNPTPVLLNISHD
jgi:hypothetical protein